MLYYSSELKLKLVEKRELALLKRYEQCSAEDSFGIYKAGYQAGIDDNVKLTSDPHFIWKLIPYEAAMVVWEIMDVYLLHDNGSESLVTSFKEIGEHKDRNGDFGLEVVRCDVILELLEDYEDESTVYT